MYTFVQQRGGGSRRDPNHKSMYKCAYMYVHLSLSPPPPRYNSVLITKYDHVSDSLGFHSDNEPEIMLNSDIVTISFSQSRIAKLRSISASGDCPEQELTVHHGDVVMMSRNSQDFFQHAILPDDSCKLRISITRWMLRDSFVTPIMHAPYCT